LLIELCDTLCKSVFKTGETLFCTKTENSDLYDLSARSLLNIETIICTPLNVNNSVYGTLTFCSEGTIENSSESDFLISLVELLGQSLGKIIKEHLLLEKFETEKKLLEMGSNLIKMASYQRTIETNEVIYTANFFKIFEIENKSKNKVFSSETFMDRVIASDRILLDEAFHKSKTEDVPPFEYRIIGKDGSYKWLKHELKCDLKKGYVLGIVQDVTDLKNTLRELKSKNEELEQFAYVAAHDLQSPLRTISGFSSLLRSKYGSVIDETGQEFLNYLIKASTRMKEQIEGLLKYSQIGRSAEIRKVDLNKLLKEILLDFEYEIKENKATISYETLPIINGYYVENRMLWQNLLSNAMKFQRKGALPKININWRENSELWYFSVTDNGIGIKEEYIPTIFNLFTKINTGDQYKGSGIGLANCKKIIELHQGDIKVYSKVGSGTTIEFSIKK